MSRYITAAMLFLLWLIYVTLVALESYGVLEVEIGDIYLTIEGKHHGVIQH